MCPPVIPGPGVWHSEKTVNMIFKLYIYRKKQQAFIVPVAFPYLL